MIPYVQSSQLSSVCPSPFTVLPSGFFCPFEQSLHLDTELSANQSSRSMIPDCDFGLTDNDSLLCVGSSIGACIVLAASVDSNGSLVVGLEIASMCRLMGSFCGVDVKS